MIPLPATVMFIFIISCLLITSLDLSSRAVYKTNKTDILKLHVYGALKLKRHVAHHWLNSNTVYTEKIPEDCSVCGIVVKKDEETVQGRSFLENRFSYPWMVSLGWHSHNRYCLGTMIDAFHILTAAHCVFDEDEDPPSIYFRNNPQIDIDWGLDIDKIIVHPLYSLINSESTNIIIAKYDIALVKLKQRIKCDKYKNPICLPPADFKFRIGSKNIFSVWDLPHQIPRRNSDRLRNGFIRNLKMSECIKLVPEINMIKNHTLCQGGTQHRICYGDSGSPLMRKINQKYYIVGIASSETNENCTLSTPMVFMDVIKFLDWIERENKTSFLSTRDNERADDFGGQGNYGGAEVNHGGAETYHGGAEVYQGRQGNGTADNEIKKGDYGRDENNEESEDYPGAYGFWMFLLQNFWR